MGVDSLPRPVRLPVERPNPRALARFDSSRFASTDDIARTVLFLVSDVSAYITGDTIVVDGGYLTR